MTSSTFADQLRVEGGGDLVEEEPLRPHRERAGDGDALLLAAGEVHGIGVHLVGEATRARSSAPAQGVAAGTFCENLGPRHKFSSGVMWGKRLYC